MKKIITLFLSSLFVASSIMAQVTTLYLVDHYNGGVSQTGMSAQPSGGYVVTDYTGNEALITTALPGPAPSYSFTGWYTNNSNFRLQESPFVKFKAKRTTAKSQNFSFTFRFTDNTTASFTKTAALTTVYQDIFWDLTSDIATLEAGGKIIDKLAEIQIPLTIGNDDGLYLDDVLMGDSANPCIYSRPTLDLITSKSLKFNQITPLDVAISGITDGGSAKPPITIAVKSSDITIADTTMIIYTSPDPTGTIQIIGAQPPKKGSTSFSVTVSDLADCNFKVSKSFTVTVGTESLDFSINPVTKTVKANAGEQIIAITGITNIGKGNTPDNYRGLSMKAAITSGAAYISDYTSTIAIDSAGGGVAELRYTPNPTLTGKATFAISLESEWGATKKTVNHTVTITEAGIALTDVQENKLEAYPNPATDLINVVLPEGTEMVEIVDMAGTVVKTIDVVGQTGTIIIPTAGIAKGAYIVKAAGASANIVIK